MVPHVCDRLVRREEFISEEEGGSRERREMCVERKCGDTRTGKGYSLRRLKVKIPGGMNEARR
eukprot:768580-Hanusia_phi.AAC.11